MQRITLRMPADFGFRAGQYLEVMHPEGAIPLSIASAPHRLPELHLHYRSTAGAPEATRMDELLAAEPELTVRGPAGDVALPERLEAPALLVAGGTGIAQIMSFLDALGPVDPGAAVSLLWCADVEDDFYLRDELLALEAPWLDVVLIADAERDAGNRGMVWLREQAPRRVGPRSPVILAGGPGFVYAAVAALEQAGIDRGDLQSDVFSYAPR